MTLAQNRGTDLVRSPRVRAAAARASIKLREYDNKPVPQWLRDIANGKEVKPPTR